MLKQQTMFKDIQIGDIVKIETSGSEYIVVEKKNSFVKSKGELGVDEILRDLLFLSDRSGMYIGYITADQVREHIYDREVVGNKMTNYLNFIRNRYNIYIIDQSEFKLGYRVTQLPNDFWIIKYDQCSNSFYIATERGAIWQEDLERNLKYFNLYCAVIVNLNNFLKERK